MEHCIGLNRSVQQFVQRLNDLNLYLLYFPEENSKQLDQNEIIEILDQGKAPTWHEAMVNANIDIFEMIYEESVSYFKPLEKLEKITHINGPSAASLPKDNKKSFIGSVGKSSKNPKVSNMCCYYCDKNYHNTADCRAFDKFKHQKKACFEAKSRPGKKYLAFILDEINALKKLLKLEMTANRNKRKTEYFLISLY
jgi:hypothetical protein